MWMDGKVPPPQVSNPASGGPGPEQIGSTCWGNLFLATTARFFHVLLSSNGFHSSSLRGSGFSEAGSTRAPGRQIPTPISFFVTVPSESLTLANQRHEGEVDVQNMHRFGKRMIPNQ
jgi:hypothetical protein